MKRSNWVRLIAVILIISMLAAPVSAATNRGNDGVRTNGVVGIIVEFIRDIIRDIFDDWFDEPGDEEPTPTPPVNPTTPTQPGETEPEETDPTEPGETKPTQPGETEPEETDPTEPGETDPTEPAEDEKKPETTLNLVEGYENTENGHLLRAQTYTLSQVIAQQNSKPATTTTANRFGTKLGNSLGGNSIGTGLKPMGTKVTTLAEGDPNVITLEVGGTYTFTVGGDVSGNYSNDKVTVTTNVETETTTTANRATPASGLENGDYLIINADQLNKGYRKVLLNSTTGDLLSFSSNVDVSDDKATVTNFANDKDSMVWTLAINSTDASGNHSVSLTNPDGKNLYASDSGDGSYVTVSNSSRALTLERGDNYTAELRKNGWRVKFTISRLFSSASTYLNYTSAGAKTYHDANDDGNHWYFYKISETTTSTTTVTFTAAAAGVTAITIGGVTYHINVVDPADASRDIPTKYLTPTAGSAETVSGNDGPEKALDGNSDTMWHTDWDGSDRSTHWIQFELTGNYSVDGLRILPRQGTNTRNGLITDYEIQISDDGNTFTPVTSGTWAYEGRPWKMATFDAVQTKYVRLVVKDAMSDDSRLFASAAEIRLTGTKLGDEPADPELPIVFFPVTMYNYNTDAYNVATHITEIQAAGENDPAKWNGIYLSDGSPDGYNGPTGEYTDAFAVTYELVVPEFGTDRNITNLNYNDSYILVNKRSGFAVALDTSRQTNQLVNSCDLGLGRAISSAPASFVVSYPTENADSSFLWNYYTDENYRYFISEPGKYMDFTTSSSGVNTTSRNQNHLYFSADSSDANAVVIQQQNNMYLSDHGGHSSDIYKAYDRYDEGAPFYIYKRTTSGTDDTRIPVTKNYPNVKYADFNYFNKGPGLNGHGDTFYTGMVKPKLNYTSNTNGELEFADGIVDGGLFTYDPAAITAENDYYDGVKNVYEYIGMPFVQTVVEDDKGNFIKYTFDSDANGVYFEDTDGDTYPDPVPGTATEPNNLVFKEGVPQDLPYDVADQSQNGWWPYNIYATRTENGVTKTGYGMKDVGSMSDPNLDYHFGMRADLQFSMTTNGCVKGTDDESQPITFHFSGDDDVWIFIDGKLVADLGGLHNRFDITINFDKKVNSVVYSEKNGADGDNVTGSFNDSSFETTQQLFKVNEGDEALIDMTLEEFASTTEHVMQFFYLERGAGTSNCMIEFNLPMLDSIEITKEATKSWSAALDAIDGDDKDGTLTLSPEEQATVDAIPFGFTLYKLAGPCLDENYDLLKNDIKADFKPITNTRFYVFRGDRMTGMRTTDAEGHFYLFNGETAKFITDIPVTGASYYVVEDQVPKGFLTPDYKYAGESAYGYDYYGHTMGENDSSVLKSGHIDDASKLGEHELPLSATENNSYFITAKGSIEAPDTLEFICVNYVEHNDGKAEAFANEDVIVLDYGLPVDIDPMANDLIRGDGIQSIEIVHATTEKGFEYPYVTDEETDELVIDVAAVTELINGVDLSKGLTGHSGVYTFNDVDYVPAVTDNSGNIITPAIRDTFTYTMKKQLTEVEVMSYLIKVTAVLEGIPYEVYGEAKLYIAPATIMYYEENFSTVNLDSDELKGLADPNAKRLEYLNQGMIVFESSLWDKDGGWASNSAETLPEKVDNRQEMGVVADPENSTYGSDIHYMDDSGDSNGTSRYGNTDYKAIRFMYTFTGTGSSIFARCSDTTGYMQVKVYKGVSLNNADLITTYFRDTYWKDQNETELDESGILYNIPVYTTREINRTQNDDGSFGDAVAQDLDYGTYTVVCTVAKAGTPTDGNVDGSGADFYLDGIRIMQPLNADADEALTEVANNAYNTDGEANLDVVTLREKLLTDVENGIEWDGENFVVMTDIDGALVSAEDYKGLGPKEEVYLTPGQTVRFSLKYAMPEGLRVYMGMKAPMGSAVVKVGSSTVTLENAPDCYRDITKSAEMKTLYDQATNEDDHLLYTDPTGKEVYETPDGYLYYSETGNPVPEDIIGELTPVYDMNQPYYVVTYTFTATSGIVSLTNIKVVGTYEFTIIDPSENGDVWQ